jgi:hypothetical protein
MSSDGESGEESLDIEEEIEVEETVETTVKLNLTESESSYWRYYDKDGTEKAICRLCSKSINRKHQSTKGMRSHLKAKHPVYWKKLETARMVCW